jgi:cytoskeleton protein RodZ
MPTVAEQLARAREAKELTVYQVAEITKIRTDHIRALEEGNYHVFSAPVYIRGFVRTYATLLKVDLPTVMASLDAELAQTEKFREPPRLAGESRGFLDFVMLQVSRNWQVAVPLVVLVLALLGMVLGYRAWRSYRSRDPLASLGPGLYQPSAGERAEVLPLPTNAPKN